MKPTDACWTIARKELGDGLRSRWIWTVSALLATAVLVIAFFGTAPAGVAGLAQNGAVIASLMNLTVYLVPLLALVLGCGAIIDEKRRGTLDLILVYPLSPADYFFGTFLGYTSALAIAIVSGFAPPGLALRLWAEFDLRPYLLLIGLALILGVAFLALSFLVSLLARDRGRAVVSSVFVWICAVLVFDLLLLGLLIASDGTIPSAVITALLLLNPTDVFRILCFQWIEGAAAPLGLAPAMPFVPPTALLATALALWTIVPLGLCYAIFRRRIANDSLL